jgi:flagellar L-ring protein precursor FlgH
MKSPAHPIGIIGSRIATAVVVLALGACATTTEDELAARTFDPPDPAYTMPPEAKDGSIYQAASNRFFFEDTRARRIGDVINVILDEQTDATKSASSNAGRDTSINLPNPTLFGGALSVKGRNILQIEAEGGTSFSGSGDSSQSNRLTGSVAVTVHEVLPNGTLRIRGEKVLTLNHGTETVRVSGLVRSADIDPSNTVQSSRLADADISYRGTGAIADSSRPGWLTRVFTSALWPF